MKKFSDYNSITRDIIRSLLVEKLGKGQESNIGFTNDGIFIEKTAIVGCDARDILNIASSFGLTTLITSTTDRNVLISIF